MGGFLGTAVGGDGLLFLLKADSPGGRQGGEEG